MKATAAASGRSKSFSTEVSRVVIPAATWARNLDAFDDILLGGFGTPRGGFVIVWKSSDLSRKRLGHRETARQLRRRLRRCHPSNWLSVARQSLAASCGVGPTVFHWLVQIIRRHGSGGEEAGDGIELVLE
jgi:hypothetical protein